jgi:hypothetical protein
MFLESGTEHLLFVDADIGFDPLQVVAMLEFDQEFVAGAAPVKAYFDGGLRYAATPCTGSERDASGRFITAERVGGSLMLLKRTVFERMIAAYPATRYTYDFVSRNEESSDRFALFDPLLVGGRYLSEDYAFCYRWRALGGRIWRDTEQWAGYSDRSNSGVERSHRPTKLRSSVRMGRRADALPARRITSQAGKNSALRRPRWGMS